MHFINTWSYVSKPISLFKNNSSLVCNQLSQKLTIRFETVHDLKQYSEVNRDLFNVRFSLAIILTMSLNILL